MVALPKKWVKEMGLRQGSEILITRPSLTTLLISTDSVVMTNGRQEAVLEVTDRDSADTLFRKIVSLYLHGYRFSQRLEEGRDQGHGEAAPHRDRGGRGVQG
jgi:hypothetical protein